MGNFQNFPVRHAIYLFSMHGTPCEAWLWQLTLSGSEGQIYLPRSAFSIFKLLNLQICDFMTFRGNIRGSFLPILGVIRIFKPYSKLLYSLKWLVLGPFEQFCGHFGPFGKKSQEKAKLTPPKKLSQILEKTSFVHIYNPISKYFQAHCIVFGSKCSI